MNTKHVHCQISSQRQNMSMPLSRKYITKNTIDNNRKSVNLKKNKNCSASNKKAEIPSVTNEQPMNNKQEELHQQPQQQQQLDPLLQLTLLLTLLGSSSSQ